MSQIDCDLAEFILHNKESILDQFSTLNIDCPKGLEYFFEEQVEQERVRIVKEFLLDHFPEKLDEITLTVDKTFVSILSGGHNE